MTDQGITLEELAAWIRRVDLDQTDLHNQLDHLHDHALGAARGGPPANQRGNWYYSNVGDWVEDWFAVVYAQDIGTNGDCHWCARWHLHTGAIVRLTALWHSWETYRLDVERGLSVWFRDFGDSQFHEITNPTGMFRSCDANHHRLPPTLATKDRT